MRLRLSVRYVTARLLVSIVAFHVVLPMTACSGKPSGALSPALEASISGRAHLVKALKDSGRVREGSKGYLLAADRVYLDIPERRLVEEENFERGKVFALLARKHNIPKSEVERIFASRASERGRK